MPTAQRDYGKSPQSSFILGLVLPRGVGADRFADTGPRSFAAYESLYPGRPWTLFLNDWTASQTAVAHTDQGSLPFQGFLVWDTASVRLDADVDLWILEPNGNLYIPWLGSVTPNGTLTNDSYADSTWYEGYLTNRYVENGRYRFYANLYQDPNDHRPIYDIQFRYGFTDALSSLYDPNFPELSRLTSWLDDPSPTFTEVEAGAYTDLQYAAFLDIGTPAPPLVAPSSAPLTVQGRGALLGPTSAQLEMVREALETRSPSESRGVASARSLPTGLREVRR